MAGNLISIKKVAQLMDVSEKTVKRWIKKDPIFDDGVVRKNQSLFVKRQALEEFFSAYQEGERRE